MASAAIRLTDSEATLKSLLLETCKYIGTLPNAKEPTLRFTGGWVRDKLLGSTSPDIDIGIDIMTGFRFGTLMQQYLALPETKKTYQEDVLGGLAKIEANPEKSKHLETVTTRILGLDIDLVNLRKETYADDSRNPTMEFGSPKDDALRRDATVNALFYNLSTSEVEDFTEQGLKDLDSKLLRTPLEPLQTFKDDPLRVLRCIRFASRLDFQIVPEAQQAMKDASIREALKQKISRERVGVEITKMLKGADPHAALSLINKLELYDTIFTDPTKQDYDPPVTAKWSQSYDRFLDIERTSPATSAASTSGELVKKVLIRNKDDLFLGWVLSCFVPWARVSPKLAEKSSSKRPLSSAFLAAREGIKADHKICKLIDDAVSHMTSVIEIKDATDSGNETGVPSLKRKKSMVSREEQGRRIRSWGSHWRSIVLYALLTQTSETDNPTESEKVLDDYAQYLSELRNLDLLEVDSLKHFVTGNQISAALGGTKPGPWMKKALDMVMEWQLRNPGQTDPEQAISEVLERKRELGIP